MTLALGLTILFITLALVGALTTTIMILRRQGLYPRLREVLAWILVLLPALFLILIRKWMWAAHINPIELAFSWYHYLWLGAMVAMSVMLALQARRDRKEQTPVFGHLTHADLLVLRFAVLLISIEMVKQIFFAQLFIGQYQYYLIPYQFCSVPLYICLLAPLLKKGKLKQALYDFLGIFMLIAGLMVMLLPMTVYVVNVYICIHTMLWHGGMAAVGVYIIAYRRMGTSFKQVIRGAIILFGFILSAALINIVIHYFGGPALQQFKPFFLDPWAPEGYQAIFILSGIYSSLVYQLGLPIGVAFPLYLFLYTFAFTVGGLIVWSSARLVIYLKHQKAPLAQFDLTEHELVNDQGQ